jgi:hypothetical protein
MKTNRFAIALCFAALCTPACLALSELSVSSNPGSEDGPAGPSADSSSSSLPEAPSAAMAFAAGLSKNGMSLGQDTGLLLRTDPFSTVALSVTMGVAGFGFQIATPLATKINLRGGASFFNYNPQVTEDGIPIDGAIRFRSVNAGVDLFFYRNTFHITPGVTMYNGNKANATANIAGGSSFTINDTDYVSSVTNPVHGTFDVNLGHKFAPSLTMGFGNMLRRDSHWSVPTEFGVEYIGQPKFTLNMTGTVCDVADGCTPILSDPGTVANLQQEQATINKDIAPLRFYPIASIGLSYRFGRNLKSSVWR